MIHSYCWNMGKFLWKLAFPRSGKTIFWDVSSVGWKTQTKLTEVSKIKLEFFNVLKIYGMLLPFVIIKLFAFECCYNIPLMYVISQRLCGSYFKCVEIALA